MKVTHITVEIPGVVDTFGPLTIEANGRISAGPFRLGWCENGAVEWSRDAARVAGKHEAAIIALARNVFSDEWGGKATDSRMSGEGVG